MLELYRNIKKYRIESLLTQQELAEKAGYKDKSMIAKIEKGLVDLPQSKIKLFADILGVTPSILMGETDYDFDRRTAQFFSGINPNSLPDYLMTGKEKEGGERYYLNEETAKAAQEIFENKELRALFDATRDADPEDLRALHSMALALKRKERGNIDDTGC